MRKLLSGLGVFLCLAVGSPVCMAGSARCASAVDHIKIVANRGDLAIAKLLIDSAIEDRTALRCDDAQGEQLMQLRQAVYTKFIIAQIDSAKRHALADRDGHAALRDIVRANEAAKVIRVKLQGIDDLFAAALFSAATQNLESAAKAEERGDLALRDMLRTQAAAMLSLACEVDPRIKKLLIKNSIPLP